MSIVPVQRSGEYLYRRAGSAREQSCSLGPVAPSSRPEDRGLSANAA